MSSNASIRAFHLSSHRPIQLPRILQMCTCGGDVLLDYLLLEQASSAGEGSLHAFYSGIFNTSLDPSQYPT